jgi:hypothetical protein
VDRKQELSLGMDDLMEIFGMAEDKPEAQGLDAVLEDMILAPGDSSAVLPSALPSGEAASPVAPAIESPGLGIHDYDAFKRSVIERYEREKADDETRRFAKQQTQAAAAQQQEAIARYDAQRAALEGENRRAELLEKYKQAKEAAKTAQANQAAVAALEAVKTAPQPQAPAQKAEQAGFGLDLPRCLALASMVELTREELSKHLAEKIGAKAAKIMMAKTLEKACALYPKIYNRGGRDPKGQVRPDGSLDADLLARSFYATLEQERVQHVGQALHDLLEIRFIAMEVGLGVGPKGAMVSQTLHALEQHFAKQKISQDLIHWYFSDVIPSTVVQDGD